MRILCLFLLLGGPVLLSACAGSRAATNPNPHGFWHTNRFDRNGMATGRWRTYYDAGDTHTQPFTTGRYRHGRPVRTFQYYAPTGKLDRTERYKRDGFCELTYWHLDGQVARTGHGQWVTGKGRAPRFYWYGPWTSYDTTGQITSVQTYVDGWQTRAETYKAGKLTQVETFDKDKRTRVEIYVDGQLIRIENFEKGLRTGTANTL